MRADAADDHGQCRAGPGDDQDGGQGDGQPGDVATYTITVTNQSTATAAASNVDMTDTVPAATLAHLTALTAQDGGSASLVMGTASWPTVASLAPGASATVHLQATLAAVFPVGTTTLTSTAGDESG